MKSLTVTRLKWRLSVTSWCACTQWVEPPNLVTHNNWQQQQPPGCIEPLGRQAAWAIASVPRCQSYGAQAKKAGVRVPCAVVCEANLWSDILRTFREMKRMPEETECVGRNNVWTIKTKTIRKSVKINWRINRRGCTNNLTLYGVSYKYIHMLVWK